MTPEEVVELVLKEPEGARLFKADLHIHTRHSGEDTCVMTAEEAVEVAAAKGMNMIALTDHKCCEGYAAAAAHIVKKAIPIGLIPGVEVSTGLQGVHLLAYFRPSADPDKTANDIRNALVELGVHLNAQQNEPYTAKTIMTPSMATDALHKRGALVVVAHAEKACAAKGKDKTDLLANKHVQGFELSSSPMPDELKVPVSRTCAICGSDAHTPAEVGEACMFVRGEGADFDTLYAALTDPEFRIFRSAPTTVYPYISGLLIQSPASTLTDGMLDGFRVRFNPGLNCLIGERGTFKSSVINVLRAVLGSQAASAGFNPWDERESGTNRDILQRVVGEGRTVHVVIAMSDGDHLVASGTVTKGSVQSALRTTLGVSQARLPCEACPTSLYMHDGIKSRADSVSWLAGTVDESIPGVVPLVAQERDILGKLQENRRRLEALNPLKSTLLAKRKELEGLRQRRAGLGVSAELAAVVNRKEEVLDWFDGIKRQVDTAARQIDAVNASISITWSPLLPESLSASADLVIEAATAADAASTALNGIGDISRRLKALSKQVDEAHRKISIAFDGLAAEQLGQPAPGASIEAAVESYSKLGEGIAVLAEEISEKSLGLSGETDLLDTRRDLLNELDKVRAERLALRERRCAETWRAGAITIGWRPHGNTYAYMDFLKSKTSVKGLQDEEHRRPLVESISPRRLATLVRAKDNAGLAAEARLPAHIAVKFLAECPKLIDSTYELEEIDYDDAPEIRFDDQGVKKPLTELSAGQRATVLLRLILAGGGGPLVIDQPEDDIDNKVVYDEIVTCVKRQKGERQLIMATHQANIPVLGDAEKILVLKSDGKHGSLHTQGCIENREVTGYVLRILEGGREAIMRRYQKYADEGLLSYSPTH